MISRDEFTGFIEKINNQTAHVLDMLDTTLNWSRANFNAITVIKVTIDIEQTINDILNVCKNDYQAKNITITTLFDTKILNSDLEIVTIIARNMITNAIKFTPDNGEIKISFSDTILTVSDNGVGMSEDMVQSIFKRQYVSKRGTNNEVGMGIGMQLMQNLCEKINAQIKIESQSKKGTSISLHF